MQHHVMTTPSDSDDAPLHMHIGALLIDSTNPKDRQSITHLSMHHSGAHWQSRWPLAQFPSKPSSTLSNHCPLPPPPSTNRHGGKGQGKRGWQAEEEAALQEEEHAA